VRGVVNLTKQNKKSNANETQFFDRKNMSRSDGLALHRQSVTSTDSAGSEDTSRIGSGLRLLPQGLCTRSSTLAQSLLRLRVICILVTQYQYQDVIAHFLSRHWTRHLLFALQCSGRARCAATCREQRRSHW
jgi:hypothetical protein